MKRTYKISDAGIFCEKCGNMSHNATEIRRLECRYCQTTHSPHDCLYVDLFRNAFIYDERNLNEDSLTMHENLLSGKWRILLVCLASDKVAMHKMTFYALGHPSLLVHEIGGQDAFAYISQERMTDADIDRFKRFYEKTVLIGDF